MNYNNFGKFLIVAAAGLVFPILILAEADNQSTGTITGIKVGVLGNFCKNIGENSSKIEQKIADLEAKLAGKRAQSANKIGQLQSDRDQKLTEKRAEWDIRRDSLYAKLGLKASGSEQKQAVAAFKEAVERAVLTRRAAIDNVIDNFRGVSSWIFVDRKNAGDQAILNYKISVKTALDEAQADCQKGIDNKTARKNLVDSLKTSKEKFNAEKPGIEKTKNSIQAAQNIKKEEMEKAVIDFKSALEEAKGRLKHSFPGAE